MYSRAFYMRGSYAGFIHGYIRVHINDLRTLYTAWLTMKSGGSRISGVKRVRGPQRYRVATARHEIHPKSPVATATTFNRSAFHASSGHVPVAPFASSIVARHASCASRASCIDPLLARAHVRAGPPLHASP